MLMSVISQVCLLERCTVRVLERLTKFADS